MQFGLGRRKVRTQRRHGMPIVNPFVFYPWRVYDFTKGAYAWISLALRHRRIPGSFLASCGVRPAQRQRF